MLQIQIDIGNLFWDTPDLFWLHQNPTMLRGPTFNKHYFQEKKIVDYF